MAAHAELAGRQAGGLDQEAAHLACPGQRQLPVRGETGGLHRPVVGVADDVDHGGRLREHRHQFGQRVAGGRREFGLARGEEQVAGEVDAHGFVRHQFHRGEPLQFLRGHGHPGEVVEGGDQLAVFHRGGRLRFRDWRGRGFDGAHRFSWSRLFAQPVADEHVRAGLLAAGSWLLGVLGSAVQADLLADRLEHQGGSGLLRLHRQCFVRDPVGKAVGEDLLVRPLVDEQGEEEDEQGHHQVGPGDGPVGRPGDARAVEGVLDDEHRLGGLRPAGERRRKLGGRQWGSGRRSGRRGGFPRERRVHACSSTGNRANARKIFRSRQPGNGCRTGDDNKKSPCRREAAGAWQNTGEGSTISRRPAGI